MPRLTVELPDDVASRLADVARARGVSTETAARELMEAGLSSDVSDFIGLGHSWRGDLSERAKELRRAGFNQQAVLDRADELAARFEDHDPDPADIKDAVALRAVRLAAHGPADAERRLADEVSVARAEGHSWAAIGAMLGTSSEAARERYG